MINEILAFSSSNILDWIEKHNTIDVPVNISDWFLSGSNSNLAKYEIVEGAVIDPSGHIVFYDNLDFDYTNNQSVRKRVLGVTYDMN